MSGSDSRFVPKLGSKSSSQSAIKSGLQPQQQSSPPPPSPPTAAIQSKDGEIILRLHVKPGAKQSRLTELTDQHLVVQIGAPPREGEANDEVVRWVAEQLGVRRGQVKLAIGHKSREKIVRIQTGANNKDMTVVEVEAKLRAEL